MVVKKRHLCCHVLICMLSCLYEAGAQISVGMLTGAKLNAIQTSVPFLNIAPDGRSSGMGDGGGASAADIQSQHWNPAKGNRQYFTFGVGLHLGSLNWDLSYLLPREGLNSPLYNTFRLTFAAELRN